MDDKDFLRELCMQIVELMRTYHYNSNGSDYECAHCFLRPRSNPDEIIHKDDCIGLKCLAWLDANPE